jgi:hypothetical protein
MNFNKNIVFKNDGTMIVRAGTQTNCGGIAQVHVRIEKSSNSNINFIPELSSFSSESEYGLSVPGAKVPIQFLSALYKGAEKAYRDSGYNEGLCYELLEALVHRTDATEAKFTAVGEISIFGWIDNQYK